MILVKAQLTIAPEGRHSFLQAMAALVQASRSEPGCLSFGCYEDVSSPNAFTVLEEWQDRASFERHEAASHLVAFKAQVGGMIVSREATRVYAVSAVGGLPS